MTLTILLSLSLAAQPASAADARRGKAAKRSRPAEASPLLQQDITIKGKDASGPRIHAPPPSADPAVLQEVVESLDVYRQEHRSQAAKVSLEATARRLSRPFPKPPILVFAPRRSSRYDRWVFQVWEDSRMVWQTQGTGVLSERIEWDGTGASGEMAAAAGRGYRFRFTGQRGDEEYALESEPVRFDSLAFQEFMGEQHFEVANSRLFEEDESSPSHASAEYLEVLADRMRRVTVKDHVYRLVLFQAKPDSQLAQRRAKALSRHLAKSLLISPSRVAVDLQTAGRRGDVTLCILPPERGSSIRFEP